MVAQLDRAQREALDRALVAAADDVLADPERVVEQVEDARDHVLDQRLRAEADGDADHAGAGDQRRDLHAHGRQRHQHRHDQEDDEQDVAQDRQQRAHARAAAGLVRVGAARRRRWLAWMRWSIRVRTTCQAKSATSRITMPLNTPRSSRVAAVSLAVRVSRSMPQPQASSQIAPMIRSARAPRSSAAASTLGGPLASGAPGGVRNGRPTDRRRSTAAGRAAATSEQPEQPSSAPNTHSSHNTANSIDTPSVMLRARSRRSSLGIGERRAPPQRDHGQHEQDQPERVGDRQPRPAGRRRSRAAPAWPPSRRRTSSAGSALQRRPMPRRGVADRERPAVARCCGDSRKRARAPHSTATTMVRNSALRIVLSKGGQLNSSSAPRLPTAKLASQSRL